MDNKNRHVTRKSSAKKGGQFYFIYDGDGQNFIVEDKTKRGLPVVENSIYESLKLVADKGKFYDGNGRGDMSCQLDGIFPRRTTLLSKYANLVILWIFATGL